jgi:hypothetical protein
VGLTGKALKSKGKRLPLCLLTPSGKIIPKYGSNGKFIPKMMKLVKFGI